MAALAPDALGVVPAAVVRSFAPCRSHVVPIVPFVPVLLQKQQQLGSSLEHDLVKW